MTDSLSGAATVATEPPPQVMATLAALRLIERLRGKHGELLFYQSGGCCEGTPPMCFPVGEFLVGDRDVLLGRIGGAEFWISAPHFEYSRHTQLIIDAAEGRGTMFSLDEGEGQHFRMRLRLFDDDEYAALQAAGKV